MSVQVTPHPEWVVDLDRALEPHRLAVLTTPVVEHSAENTLVEQRMQDLLIAFYPIIRDFPQWLQLLLDRSPPESAVFFRDNIRVERRHDAMWRAMGDAFGVPKGRFQRHEPMLEAVRDFHDFLSASCQVASFAEGVAATNYAVEGVAQRISAKALRGLGKNDKLGPRGRWWLEEHAKYDDEHPVHALEIIKSCVQRGEAPQSVTDSALKSLGLMKEAMVASYGS